MTALHYVSPLPREECVRRLKEKVRLFWGGAKDAPRGRVSDRGATLRMPIWYRNSFQTILRLSLSDNPAGGTDLTCRFGINRFVLVFLGFWFAGVAGFGILAVAQTPFSGETVAVSMPLAPLFMIVFGSGLVGFGRYIARNEKAELLAFVAGTLDAVPAD